MIALMPSVMKRSLYSSCTHCWSLLIVELGSSGFTSQVCPSYRSRCCATRRCSAPGPRHLPGGDVEAVEEIGRSDTEDQGSKPSLIVVPCGLAPDLVRHRIRPVAKARGCLSERQRGALGIGEVGRLPPGRHREDAFVGLAHLLGAACARVNAGAAAVDLTRPQVDEIQRLLRHATPARSLEQALDSLH